MLRQFVAAVAVASSIVAPGFAHADTTLTVGGTTQVIDTGGPVAPIALSGVLGGKYDDGPSKAVPYPAALVGMPRSVQIGTTNLLNAIQSTEGPKRALGISQGAIVESEVKKQLMALPVSQRPKDLSFVAIADPTRPGHGILTQLGYHQTATPYDTTWVTREYDGFADWPDRFNVVAIVNVIAGVAYVHPYYGGAIPADAVTTTTVNSAGGKNTDILIKNPNLPMLQPLRDLGVDKHLVNAIQGILKPMVDAGYSRNDKPKATTPAVTAPTTDVKTSVKAVSDVKTSAKHQIADKPERKHKHSADKPKHVRADKPAGEHKHEHKGHKADKGNSAS